jgi:hypothetical protein
VTLIAAIALAQRYGVSGVGAGILIGACAQLTPLGIGLSRLLGGKLAELWRPREAISLLGAAGAGFATARLLSAVLTQPLALMLAPLLGLIAAAAVFLAIGGVQPRDRERGRRLTGALSARLAGMAGNSPRWSGRS